MYRVYLGNLDQQVTEETLQTLFAEHGLTVSGILVKRGYGFVDCPDQNTFDNAIDKLNGYNFMGSVLQVEPSTVSKRRRSSRIQIRNLPHPTSKEDIEQLVSAYGKVQRCDIVTSNIDTYVTVSYENADEAQSALDELDNFDYKGAMLRVEFTGNGGRGSSRGSARNSATNLNRNANYMLRILVPSEYVGAIIGKRGEKIRAITSECKTSRIDVHSKENSGLIEKAISISGQPDSVTSACLEILKVMQQESTSNNRGEVILKILADDRYCGRVIGKEGKVIKKIRDDTETKVVVSNAQELAAIYPDRVISVRGTIENLSRAEAAISVILRECLEKDMLNMRGGVMVHSSMSGGLGLLPSPPGIYPGMRPYGGNMGGPNCYPTGPVYGSMSLGHIGAGGPPSNPLGEVYQISVPNAAVGAIIGTGGVNIKQIIRDSSAFVTIEPKKDVESSPSSERMVTIKGNPDACWRASYFVFEKMKYEGFAGNDEVRLRSSIKIPKSLVGRIIGKGGKNVREIQQTTGAIIKLPDDPNCESEQATLDVFGNFMSTQSAYNRIRTILTQSQQQQQQTGFHPSGVPHDIRPQLLQQQ